MGEVIAEVDATPVPCDEARELLDLLALDALEPGEAARVRAHVATCVDCRAAYQAARQIADALLLAPEPVNPPGHLRRRLLAMAQAEMPLESPISGWRRLMQRFSPVLAVVSTAAALVAVAWALTIHGRLTEAERQVRALQADMAAQAEMVAIMMAPNVAERELLGTDMAPTARGRLYVDPASRTAVLLAQGLPVLPADKAYQLWLIGEEGNRTSGGLFTVSGGGSGVLLIHFPAEVTRFARVGVTPEPRGGSPGPTGPRMMGGNL
jgi:anti-sigma-K factor RskA